MQRLMSSNRFAAVASCITCTPNHSVNVQSVSPSYSQHNLTHVTPSQTSNTSSVCTPMSATGTLHPAMCPAPAHICPDPAWNGLNIAMYTLANHYMQTRYIRPYRGKKTGTWSCNYNTCPVAMQSHKLEFLPSYHILPAATHSTVTDDQKALKHSLLQPEVHGNIIQMQPLMMPSVHGILYMFCIQAYAQAIYQYTIHTQHNLQQKDQHWQSN